MRVGAQRWATGDELACLAAMEEAVRILPPEPSAERARVLAAHAQWLLLAGRRRDALGRAEEALAVARTIGARAEEGHALDILGSCTGDTEHLVAARRIAEEVGNAEGITRADINLSAVLWSRGRLREANDVGRRGLAAARELGLERSMGGFLAESVAGDLYDLGDWEESDRVLAEALEYQTAAAARLQTIKAMLEFARGDFRAAREHLELARRLSPSPSKGPGRSLPRHPRHLRAPLRRCTRHRRRGRRRPRSTRARTTATPLGRRRRDLRARPLGGGRLRRAGPRGTLPSRCGGGPPAGRNPARRLSSDRPARTDGRHRGRLAGLLRRARRGGAVPAGGPTGPRAVGGCGAGHGSSCHIGSCTPAGDRPRRCLRSRRRRHRSNRCSGPHTRRRWGWERPIRREIELLAKRGRLRLDEQVDAGPRPDVPASPAASLGLTRREAEVLTLLAAGRTNRQIGQELFITEKTASVHVSRILAKLGVAGRGEAAAIAHRLELDR